MSVATDSRRLPVVVVAGQLPPPVHGQNLMIERILGALSADRRFETVHLPYRFSSRLERVGKARPEKLLEAAVVLARARRLRERHGALDLVIHPTGGPALVPMLRDLALLPALRRLGRRLWVQVHAGGVARFLDQGPRGAVARRLVHLAHRGVDGALVMTETGREDAAALGLERVELVPNWVPDENPGGRLPSADDGPEILHIGQLSIGKGTPTLVEAFARLVRERPAARLTLAGEFVPPFDEATCRARLATLGVSHAVRLAGLVRGEAKVALFRSSHLLAFTSVLPEGHPLVLAEALCWGLPVVSSDGDASVEIAGDAAIVYASRGDATDALHRALVRATDPEARRRLARLSRARFEARYADAPARYCDVVARLLSQPAHVGWGSPRSRA